ncbi:hypothetical protein P4O66_013800, partial [Electrophorus voltai]
TYFVDLSRPYDLALNHTVNMYLSSEEGVTLGVWSVLGTLFLSTSGKKPKSTLVMLTVTAFFCFYLNRAYPHRVGVAKILSSLGYHALVMDYRGFGDSTGEPTEAGLTTDALYLYHWVRARSKGSLVIFWGHSLGTFVSTNTAVILQEQDDHLAPFWMAEKIYSIAKNVLNSDKIVKMAPFDGSHGYLHNGLYRDPGLPGIIR